MTIFVILLVTLSFILSFHGILSLWQILKGWEDPQMISKNKMPKEKANSETSFSVIIPARHEVGVIGRTLESFLMQSYPKSKYQVLVPMSEDDTATIAEVKEISEKFPERIKHIIFNGLPINKPRGLNEAIKHATGDYIVIFDAEDEIHKDLLEMVNTVIAQEGRKIIQTGVRLTNWNTNWYNLHAVLEYYFWFRSRLHWYANNHFTTLAGVGVFLPKEIIKEIGGWDESCLTEDAKIGIDCSVRGYEFRILSDEKHATREEVPNQTSSFIRQRTRWIQGFMQVVGGRNWRKLEFKNQIYFLSLFLFPIIQVFLHLWVVASFIFHPKLPVGIVMISLVPSGILAFQIAVQVVGMLEMLHERNETKKAPLALALYAISYLPYQILISYSAARALVRMFTNNLSWEKTPHLNLNRPKTINPKLGEFAYERIN